MRHVTALPVPVRILSDCLSLFTAISSQFILEVCTATENRKKTLKHPNLGIQDHSRS